MRIKAIELEWFRGAAATATLALNSKSMVIYGENGSGKSSFVDAVEYVINGHKVGHLTHEYSGKYQEKGLVNTHRPKGKTTRLRVSFSNGSRLVAEVQPHGASTRCGGGTEAVLMHTWDYRRTVLRQDELAGFIRDTKGGKYSSLLPLLGLHELEVTAQNLRQLARSVCELSKRDGMKNALMTYQAKREAEFGTATDEEVIAKVESLHAKYCPDNRVTTDPTARCNEILAELEKRVARYSVEHQTHLALQDIAGLQLNQHIRAVRTASVTLAGELEPSIVERLEVLMSTDVFVGKLEDEGLVDCPACGRSIAAEAFRAHVADEKKRLWAVTNTFKARKAAVAALCDDLRSLKSGLSMPEARARLRSFTEATIESRFVYLDSLDVESHRSTCTDEDLNGIERQLLRLVEAATSASKNAPTDVQELSTDRKTAVAAKEVVESKEIAASVSRADALFAFLNSLEQGVRDEIKQQSQQVVDEVSSDIRDLWAILHPGEAIEDIRVYLPDDADKAVDIGLKFHGVEQASPRLTLSEGYRNSLGLCLFLAMAKREADKDRPLFLDDVVVSFDRNHRGMVAELLEKRFSDRQVVLFTHDREWYIELRRQLDPKRWGFKALKPYEHPSSGIRWSEKSWTFDDARARLKDEPDAAGNTVRKIMDTELAILAERLKVPLPYLHRERNDHRVAHEFLSRMILGGKRRFKKKVDGAYEPYTEAVEALSEADTLLLSWGNKSSHSFDVTPNEVDKLLAACETAMGFFECPSCKKPVYKQDVVNEKLVQCRCGQLQWRYGRS